jgi:uncharacterized membrane protein
MHWVADLWWVWAIGFIVTIAVGIYSQLKRMREIDLDKPFKGMGLFFGMGILNMIFSVLLVVAIVLHIIDYAKK